MENIKPVFSSTRKRILLEYFNNPNSHISSIAKRLNCSKQNIERHCQSLVNSGYMVHKTYLYKLTEKAQDFIKGVNGFNVGDDDIVTSSINLIQRKRGDLHSFNFQFPIEKGKCNFKKLGGYDSTPLRGWTPQYLDIETPFNAKYKNNNNKSVTGYLKSSEIYDFETLHLLANQFIKHTVEFFNTKGLVLYEEKAYCENLHIEVNDEIAKKNLKKGDKITVPLDKDRGKITPNDPAQPGKAWTDTSPIPSIGSNDPDWWDAYLKMPLVIAGLSKTIPEFVPVLTQIKSSLELEIYNKQLHQQVLLDMSNTMKEIRDSLKKDLTPKEIIDLIHSKDDLKKEEVKEHVLKLSAVEKQQLFDLFFDKFKI